MSLRDTFNSIPIEEFRQLPYEEKSGYTERIFELIDFVFDEAPEYIDYLEEIYIIANKNNHKFLKTLKNAHGQTILDIYEGMAEVEDERLEKHRNSYISAQKMTMNMMALFNLPKIQVKRPSVFELLDRIEILETSLAELSFKYKYLEAKIMGVEIPEESNEIPKDHEV